MISFIVLVLVVYAHEEHKRFQKSARQCRLPASTAISTSEECLEAWREAVGEEGGVQVEPAVKVVPFSVEKSTCGYSHADGSLYFAQKSTTNADERETLWDFICDFGEEPMEMNPNNALFVIMLSIFAASIAHMIEHACPSAVQPPHTVVLFLLGMSFSGIADLIAKNDPGHVYVRIMNSFFELEMVDVFWVFLPPLLFEDASGANWHVFFRLLPNCLLVAVPGVVINTVFTAGSVYNLFSGTGDGPADLTLLTCALMGSILSATDPVAVIGTLASLNAPDKLSTFIAGEALLNDGTAIVMFEIFYEAARGIVEFDLFEAFMSFLRLGVGGVIVGLLWSLALHGVLKLAHHMFMVQVLALFFTMYTGFFSAELEFLGVSGVLVVVTVGYYMAAEGKHNIDADHHHDLHSIMSFLATVCNESIFVLAGIIGWRLTTQDAALHAFNPLQGFTHWGELGLLYIIIHISRALAVLLLWPLLARSGYGLRTKEAAIVVFGGLRGAVGLALGLHVALNTNEPALHAATRARIAFHISGITLLTLTFNGSVIGRVYKGLKIYTDAEYKEALFSRAITASEIEVNTRIHEDLKRNWFFHNSFVDIAEGAVPHLRSRKERMDIGLLIGKIIQRANKNPSTFNHRFAKKLKMKAISAHKDVLDHSATAGTKLCNSGGIKKVMHDDETAAEIYQTILNAAHARLVKMFKRNVCDVNTYKIILSSFDHGEEAVAGELRPYGYLQHEDSDKALRGLDKKPHKEQLGYAIHVTWAALQEQLRSPPSLVSILSHFMRMQAPMEKWHRMKRNMEVVITFIFIFEQLCQELPVFSDFPKVLARTKMVLHAVREEYLASMERHGRAYFVIAEHLLCMKYIILLKQGVLEEYVARGVIQDSDYSTLNSLYLIPALEKLDKFVPSPSQVAGIKVKSREVRTRSISSRRVKSTMGPLTPSSPNVSKARDSRGPNIRKKDCEKVSFLSTSSSLRKKQATPKKRQVSRRSGESRAQSCSSRSTRTSTHMSRSTRRITLQSTT